MGNITQSVHTNFIRYVGYTLGKQDEQNTTTLSTTGSATAKKKKLKKMTRYIHSYNKKKHKTKIIPFELLVSSTPSLPLLNTNPRVKKQKPHVSSPPPPIENEKYESISSYSGEDSNTIWTIESSEASTKSIPNSPRWLIPMFRPNFSDIVSDVPEFIPIKPIHRPKYVLRDKKIRRMKKLPTSPTTFDEYCNTKDILDRLFLWSQQQQQQQQPYSLSIPDDIPKEEPCTYFEPINIRLTEHTPLVIPKERLMYPEGHLCEGLYITEWGISGDEYIERYGEPDLDLLPFIFTPDEYLKKYSEIIDKKYPHLKPSWKQIVGN
jgi:hypothetical protein